MYCSVLQCVAVCCSVLHYVVVRCGAVQYVAVHQDGKLQYFLTQMIIGEHFMVMIYVTQIYGMSHA